MSKVTKQIDRVNGKITQDLFILTRSSRQYFLHALPGKGWFPKDASEGCNPLKVLTVGISYPVGAGYFQAMGLCDLSPMDANSSYDQSQRLGTI